MKPVSFVIPAADATGITEDVLKQLFPDDWQLNAVRDWDRSDSVKEVRYNAIKKYWDDNSSNTFNYKADSYWKIRVLYYNWVTNGLFNTYDCLNDPDPRVSNLAVQWGIKHLDFSQTWNR